MEKMEYYYLVWDLTNYGDGYIMAGIYEDYESAKKRLKYCKKMVPDDDAGAECIDSWRITAIPKDLPIKDDSVFDAL